MYVSRAELDNADFAQEIRGWTRNMQLLAKQDSPVFALKGPVSLPVRRRRATGGVSTGNHAFFGDEKLKLTGIYTEDRSVEDRVLVGATLVPVSMEMAASISGLSLPLSECMLHLEGFEEWTKSTASTQTAAPKKEKPKAIPREENPMWGAW